MIIFNNYIFCITGRSKLERILPRVLVQIIKLKTCNKPGYNFTNLNFLLNNHFEYELSRECNEKIMEDLVNLYIGNKMFHFIKN